MFYALTLNLLGDCYTFNKPKLQVKVQSLGFTVSGLMNGTRELVEIYPISTVNLPELRDPKDNMILATAVAAEAEAIITEDLDLLVLQEYQEIIIVTAKDFIERYFPES